MVTLIAVTMFGVAGMSFNTAAVATTGIEEEQRRGSSSTGRACPEGFSLNRGVCQAEPTIPIITRTILVCPGENPWESPEGNCVIGISSPVNSVCPSSHPYQMFSGPPEDPYAVCAENPDGTGEFVRMEWQCETGYELDPETKHLTDRTLVRCFQVTEKIEQEIEEEGEPTCNIGKLNEDSEMCEIRPGNNNNNKRD